MRKLKKIMDKNNDKKISKKEFIKFFVRVLRKKGICRRGESIIDVVKL